MLKDWRFKRHARLIWLSSCLVALHFVESDKKLALGTQPTSYHHHHHHHSGSPSHKSEGSEEQEVSASPPEMIAMKGMASAGISHLKPSGKLSKCLGQDLRVDKIVQVTKHCEAETGEGKSETTLQGRSLCFTACMYKYLGLIGDDLMFTAGIDSVVVDIFPPIAHPQAKRAIRNCAKQSVLPLSKSDNCTSFGPVKGCIMKSAQNICNGEYY